MVEHPPEASVPLADEITDCPHRHVLHQGQRKRFTRSSTLPGPPFGNGLEPTLRALPEWFPA